MAALLGARPRSARVKNAAHRNCTVWWWWEPRTRTAIIESARVIGLAMLSPAKRVPFELDSFGLGMLVQHVAKAGAHRCLVGLGGSASNDGGFGLARALGWRFFDGTGQPLTSWTELSKLSRISRPLEHTWPNSITVASDVENPLCGRNGATRVYGPQKGLGPEKLHLAESYLRRLSRVVGWGPGRDLAEAPGAGAAGGLGFGFMAFCGARLESGFSLFARRAGLNRRLEKTNLVLTGEGRIDRSTFMGKGVGAIAHLCRKKGIPCIGLAGEMAGEAFARRTFTEVRALTDLVTSVQAKRRAFYWLERLAVKAARDFRPLSRRTDGVRSRK